MPEGHPFAGKPGRLRGIYRGVRRLRGAVCADAVQRGRRAMLRLKLAGEIASGQVGDAEPGGMEVAVGAQPSVLACVRNPTNSH